MKSSKTTAKKCTKKCVARAKLLFASSDLLLFFYRSRYVYIPCQDSDQDFEPGLVAKLDNFSLLPITIKRRVFVAIMEGKLQLGLGRVGLGLRLGLGLG